MYNCHYDVVPVFNLGKSTIYAGRLSDVMRSDKPFKLIVMCDPEPLAHAREMVELSGPAEKIIPRSMTEFTELPIMRLNWPDMSAAPFLTRKWWGDLLKVIRKLEGPVAVCCYGGHGRTGTALSCMVGLTSLVPKTADPVKYVRDHYCDEAVETLAQINYIEAVTGRKVYENGSYFTKSFTQGTTKASSQATTSSTTDTQGEFGDGMFSFVWDPDKKVYVAYPREQAIEVAKSAAKSAEVFKQQPKETAREMMDRVFGPVPSKTSVPNLPLSDRVAAARAKVSDARASAKANDKTRKSARERAMEKIAKVIDQKLDVREQDLADQAARAEANTVTLGELDKKGYGI